MRALVFVWLWLGLVVPASAWASSISLSLASPTIEVGQSTRLLVTVVDAQPRTAPVVPAPAGASVVFAERHQEFTASPATGIVQTFRYAYTVTVDQQGEFVLGPVEVDIGRDKLRSDTLTLKVVERGTVDRSAEPLDAKSWFEPTEAWEGQLVVYHAELQARVPVRDVQWRWPPMEGLRQPQHGQGEESNTRIGDPAGDITVFRVAAPLIAVGTGDREQPPAVARAAVVVGRLGAFGMLQTRTKNVPSTMAPLTVKKLPAAPPGFTGLVGEFQLRSQLGKTRNVAVGESVRWRVRVFGTGVLDGFELEPPEMPGVQVYADKSDVNGRMQGGTYMGERTFEMVLVPTEPGELQLPPLKVVTFSPKQGRYVVLQAKLQPLRVVGEGEGAELQSFGTSSTEEVEVREAVELVEPYTWGPATSPPLTPAIPVLLLGAAAPGFGVLAWQGMLGLRRRREEQRVAAEAARAPSALLVSLPEDPEQRLAVLDQALREALARFAGVEVGALDREATLEALPPELSEQIHRLLRILDRARFAGTMRGADDLEADVRDAVVALEAA